MAIKQSAKLAREEAANLDLPNSFLPDKIEKEVGPVRIRVIPCLNEFVAVMLFRHDASIEVPVESQFKSEGIVVGVGPGLPCANGSRPEPQLKIGDVVFFSDRGIVTTVNSQSPPYKGQKVVLMSERSIFAKLPPVEFEIIQ